MRETEWKKDPRDVDNLFWATGLLSFVSCFIFMLLTNLLSTNVYYWQWWMENARGNDNWMEGRTTIAWGGGNNSSMREREKQWDKTENNNGTEGRMTTGWGGGNDNGMEWRTTRQGRGQGTTTTRDHHHGHHHQAQETVISWAYFFLSCFWSRGHVSLGLFLCCFFFFYFSGPTYYMTTSTCSYCS
jgi:hypothetical protein